MNKIKPVYRSLKGKIYAGNCLDVLKQLPNESIHCCITSPPYYRQRRYTKSKKEIGIEQLPEDYIENLVKVFMEVKRVLVKTGTMWINIGDKYVSSSGVNPEPALNVNRSKSNKARTIRVSNFFKESKYILKKKDLIGIPWLLALKLREKGLYLRQDLIWNKVNCMPGSFTDRCVTSHEYVFLLSKSSRYYFDYKSIREKSTSRKSYKGLVLVGGEGNRDKYQGANIVYENKNKRSVWDINPSNKALNNYAAFPEELVKNCLIAGCPENGYVLDPFLGSGTTALVANRYNRKFIGIDISREYIKKDAIPRIKEEINRPKLNIRRKKKEAEDLVKEQTKIF